jgi:hypothetical protein
MKYNVVISKTANEKMDYLQIMSEDMFSVNIVLLGDVKVEDKRDE